MRRHLMRQARSGARSTERSRDHTRAPPRARRQCLPAIPARSGVRPRRPRGGSV